MFRARAKGLAAVGLMYLSTQASATILPENNLHLEDNLHSKNANITEQQFNDIIDQADAIYKDVVASHGATLSFSRNWNDSTVNAYANQMGNNWTVAMFGGLARRPEVTPDGFALVVCHELGHHLGGFFFYNSTPWAASEGQSDYFATQACAKELWKDDIAGNATARDTVEAAAKDGCDTAWATEQEQNLCYRIAMGGKSLAVLLGALGGNPNVNFDTPDTTEVSSSNDRHPAAQCRLDTYYNGGLCDMKFNIDLIPGKDHADGRNSAGAEDEARLYSCNRAAGHTVGNRPLCWFKPRA